MYENDSKAVAAIIADFADGAFSLAGDDAGSAIADERIAAIVTGFATSSDFTAGDRRAEIGGGIAEQVGAAVAIDFADNAHTDA